jgi:hypothetical protein
MKDLILHECLPVYGRNEIKDTSPVCFVGKRAWQVFNDDIATELGSEQVRFADRLSEPGDGASLFFASSSKDIVLIRASRAQPSHTEKLTEQLKRQAEHLARCGLETGIAMFADELAPQTISEFSNDYFLAPATFGSDMCQVFQDEDAARTRAVVRRLNDKATSSEYLDENLAACGAFDLTSEDGTDNFLRSAPGPWVIKPAHGAGAQQITHVFTRHELFQSRTEQKARWGKLVGQRVFGGQDLFAYFIIDPSKEGPTFVMAGRTLMVGQHYVGNLWDREFESSADLSLPISVARSHHAHARQHGAKSFHEGQDWRDGYKSYVETNPRLCGGSPIAIYRKRTNLDPERVTSLILPIDGSEPCELLRHLSSIEASPTRGSGVMVYAIMETPIPLMMALVVNDFDGAIEARLRLLL